MNDMKSAVKELMSKSNYTFNDLCTLVSVLRSDVGCPWDREQTNKSIRNCIIDETYEFIEGLDNDDDVLMCEELGDVLFQIIFHSVLKKDNNSFDINDVINGICKKMILRHPHVFGNVSVENSDQVLVNWENIKNDEKQRKTPVEQLESVSRSLPSLMRCQKLQTKAAKNGLIKNVDFDNAISSVEKSVSELKELRTVEKFGELIFNVVSIAKSLETEAEEILYIENDKFIDNFKQQ